MKNLNLSVCLIQGNDESKPVNLDKYIRQLKLINLISIKVNIQHVYLASSTMIGNVTLKHKIVNPWNYLMICKAGCHSTLLCWHTHSVPVRNSKVLITHKDEPPEENYSSKLQSVLHEVTLSPVTMWLLHSVSLRPQLDKAFIIEASSKRHFDSTDQSLNVSFYRSLLCHQVCCCIAQRTCLHSVEAARSPE